MSISDKLNLWLLEHAFPFWAQHGFDPETGTAWEALDHDGVPRKDIKRRLRVQARQSYCFAISGQQKFLSRAEKLFRFTMEHGFDRESGNLIEAFNHDMNPVAALHDLYDLAFVILAAGALIQAGVDVAKELDQLERSLERLRAEQGWFENCDSVLPRRQNPHMHLFEASITVWRATKRTKFKEIAQECFSLFEQKFLQPNGVLFERFDADWAPIKHAEKQVEPGHLAEWIYLVDLYEGVFDCKTSVDFEMLFEAVRKSASPLLPDIDSPACNTRRLWPQTEYFKAAYVMRKRGLLAEQDADLPEDILTLLWDEYLNVDCLGGWYDQRNLEGELLSDLMPSSSFYHILVAIQLATQTDTGQA
jgi:mannose-6-phosphate isomerase